MKGPPNVRPDPERERRITALSSHLPPVVRGWIVRLRRPDARKARLWAGIGFCAGGLLFFLPFFGLWMVPVGLILLSEDVALLRGWTDRGLAWAERKWPRFFRV